MAFNDDLKEYELLKMNSKAENAVTAAVAATAATGAIPIPFADAPAMITEEVALMATICKIYGINIKKDGLKMLATAAISAGGATIVGKTLFSNAAKFIPGVGSVVGGAISAGTAGVVTLAMGKAFIEVCKLVKLGKLSEFDVTSQKGIDLLKEGFKAQIKKGSGKTNATTIYSSAEGVDVILSDIGAERNDVICVLWQVLGLKRAEAEELIKNLPATIEKNLSKDKADELTSKLRDAGARVYVKGNK